MAEQGTECSVQWDVHPAGTSRWSAVRYWCNAEAEGSSWQRRAVCPGSLRQQAIWAVWSMQLQQALPQEPS